MSEIFGQNTPSVPFWEDEARKYRDDLASSRAAYHRGRLQTARRLFDLAALPKGARVIDFGCGDGVFARELARDRYSVLGLDPAAAMIDLARSDGSDLSPTFEVGGADVLLDIGPFDAVVALNVLAYMTDTEMATFWNAIERQLQQDGVLLASHSNELFDLFALNSATSRFFERHFTGGTPVASLLSGAQQDQPSYNVRANPLTYLDELAQHGLEEEQQAFFNFHPLPPSLLGAVDEGRIVDPDAIARFPRWKQQFQCSTYFTLARRGGAPPDVGDLVSPVSKVNPLEQWRGDFGARYMERNRVTDESSAQAAVAFGRILDLAGIREEVSSVLEVGANVGINLHGLRRQLGPRAELAALEPNPTAAARLRDSTDLALSRVIEGMAGAIDAPDGAYDLVFTNGVLIHIPPRDLEPAMREICRVARRFVLCSEYFSHEPVEVPYHGRDGMLWKRDFGRAYRAACPELRVRYYGFLWQEELPLFDDLNWWLFEKPAAGD